MAENGDLAVLTYDNYSQLRLDKIFTNNIDYYIGLRNVYLQWNGPGPGKSLNILQFEIIVLLSLFNRINS